MSIGMLESFNANLAFALRMKLFSSDSFTRIISRLLSSSAVPLATEPNMIVRSGLILSFASSMTLSA